MLREADFWARVDKAGACWWWLGAKNDNGYGMVSDGRYGKRKRAHRVAWELTNGPIPPGLFVLHSCDNPPCVNPAHLWLGTQADNMRDMDAKGRRRWEDWFGHHQSGEANKMAKLAAAQVEEIRLLYPQGWGQRELAAMFGVSRPTISMILNRKRWP